MAIKKLGDYLNKKVQLDSKHVLSFLGVVLLFVGLVVFVGYSVTGKVTGVSHRADEINLNSPNFPDIGTVRGALDELKTEGGAGGGNGAEGVIPSCIVSADTACSAYNTQYSIYDSSYALCIILDVLGPYDQCIDAKGGMVWTKGVVEPGSLGAWATGLKRDGMSLCWGEGQYDCVDKDGNIMATSAVNAKSAREADRAGEALYAETAERSGLCTIVGMSRKMQNSENFIMEGKSTCPSDETIYTIYLKDTESVDLLTQGVNVISSMYIYYCCSVVDQYKYSIVSPSYYTSRNEVFFDVTREMNINNCGIYDGQTSNYKKSSLTGCYSEDNRAYQYTDTSGTYYWLSANCDYNGGQLPVPTYGDYYLGCYSKDGKTFRSVYIPYFDEITQ